MRKSLKLVIGIVALSGTNVFAADYNKVVTDKRTAEAEAIASQPGEDFQVPAILCKTIPDILAYNRAHRAPDPAPTKVFDNLYFVGTGGVSSWAITTSAGIILIDTLNNPQEADKFIIGGLRTLGLDPMKIKYIILTHGHADHFGGAKSLQDRIPGARIMLSPADWDYMDRVGAMRHIDVPRHDIDVTDRQRLTLGDETVTIYITPGHSPGTESLIIPVRDHRAPHTLSMWGGRPWTSESLEAPYMESLTRFRKIEAAAHIDGRLANHPYWDNSIAKLAAIQANPSGSNPYLETSTDMKRLAQIDDLCLANQKDYQIYNTSAQPPAPATSKTP